MAAFSTEERVESTIPPVFLKLRDIPDSTTNRPSVLEMCLAAEKVSGRGSIVGAQDIRGLWRIYPANKEARATLLVKGIVVRDTTLQVAGSNPFVLHDNTGEEKPTTKVWVDSIPISVANSEVEHALKKVGCELRSDIKMERARDNDGKLTRFLTGRRFVFVTVPTKPLDKKLIVCHFEARIYHQEQKFERKTVVCSRCLETGHHVSVCKNDTVCRACKTPGHKRGDAKCSLTTTVQTRKESNNLNAGDAASEKGKGNNTSKSASAGNTLGRGRESGRLRDLSHPRDRSATPKRARSSPAESHPDTASKQRKVGGPLDDWINSAGAGGDGDDDVSDYELGGGGG